MSGKSLRAVAAWATTTQDEFLRVMTEIRALDRAVFDDIVRVAMTQGATFESDRTIDFLGGHTVFGQTMFDVKTRGLKDGHREMIAGCVVPAADNKWDIQERIVQPVIQAHDLDVTL